MKTIAPGAYFAYIAEDGSVRSTGKVVKFDETTEELHMDIFRDLKLEAFASRTVYLLSGIQGNDCVRWFATKEELLAFVRRPPNPPRRKATWGYVPG